MRRERLERGRRLLPELALFAVLVAVTLSEPQSVPSATAPPFDNVWMGEKTHTLVTDGPAALLWLNDPWFRYVPQAVLLAVLDPGRPTVQDAIRINARYVLFAEGLALPVALGATARRLYGRSAGLAALGVVVVGRVAMFAGGPQAVLDYGTLGTAHLLLLRMTIRSTALVPFRWHLLIVFFAVATGWLLHRGGDTPWWTPALLASLGVALVPLGLYEWRPWLRNLLGLVAFGNHWYWGLALPLVPPVVAAVHEATDAAPETGATGWAGLAGVGLGLVGSIQLAQGFVLAMAVAYAYALRDAWRPLAATAGVAAFVWLPTPVVALLNRAWYRSEGTRVLAVSPAAVPSVVLTAGLGSALLVAARRTDATRAADLTLFAAVVGAWTGLRIVDLAFVGYWSGSTLSVFRPLAYLVAAAGLASVLRALVPDRVEAVLGGRPPP